MNRARSPVDGFPFADQLLSFGVGCLARVCKARSDLFVAIELCDICLVADDNEQLLAPFFAAFGSSEDSHTGSGLL